MCGSQNYIIINIVRPYNARELLTFSAAFSSGVNFFGGIATKPQVTSASCERYTAVRCRLCVLQKGQRSYFVSLPQVLPDRTPSPDSLTLRERTRKVCQLVPYFHFQFQNGSSAPFACILGLNTTSRPRSRNHYQLNVLNSAF